MKECLSACHVYTEKRRNVRYRELLTSACLLVQVDATAINTRRLVSDHVRATGGGELLGELG